MIAKNQRMTLECTRFGSELEGVCDNEGMAVFVPGALPGERLEVLVTKVCPRYAFARLERVVTPSPDRVEPLCPAYRLCGGCDGQHIRYAAALAAKRAQVWDCLTRIGGLQLAEADVPPVVGMAEPWRFRNKTALPVGGTANEPRLGFYRRRSHQLVDVEDCPVSMARLGPMIAALKGWMRRAGVEPYDELTGKGLLRHAVLRTNRQGDAMLLLVATQAKLPDVPLLVSALQKALPGFKALHLSVNKARTNVILGSCSQKLWGEEAINETLLGLTFQISPLSFFQVNPEQTEKLYQKAIELAELEPGDTVVDAYAGAGTIALCMAAKAQRVVGIEIVPQAVDSARRNAEINHVVNVDFYADAVENRLPKLVAQGLRPDVVMLDPPRKGVEPPVIEAVLAAKPRKVVYVSCHVPTQARDVKLLAEGGYRFQACQPVDMFCHAGGVENVLSMTYNNQKE